MKIEKSKGVEGISIMEEKMKNMGEDMADVRFKEKNMRHHLQKDNKKLKSQLQENGEQISTMASLSMESIHYRHPQKNMHSFPQRPIVLVSN